MQATAPEPRAISPVDYVRFMIFVGFVLICFLGGGGSRPDIQSLLYLRPAAILCLTAIVLLPAPIEWRAIRVPLALLGLFALLMAAQLIPLPPGLWTQLPGRAPLIEAAAIAGIPQPWRPLSIAPDLTLNSLVALIIPLTALVGFAALRDQYRYWLILILIVAALAGALLGMAQLTGGPDSPFYLYRITNGDSAVGFMSNRNHQAFLLAATYPMLAIWAASPRPDARAAHFRATAAVALGIFLVPLLLVTGSRGGLLLGLGGAALACLLFFREQRALRGPGGVGPRWAGIAILGVGAALVLFAAVAMSRAEAVNRLLAKDIASDSRVANLPVFTRMARDFFPAGAGSGTFDPLYRIYEPHEALSPNYLNQAHNDLADLAITGGLPALVLLAAFLAWWAARSIRVMVRPGSSWPGTAAGRLGAAVILLFMTASLIDYPLRTPALAMVFAIACGWLSSARSAATTTAKADP